MTVLLVLFTLIVFLVLDHVVQQRRTSPSLATRRTGAKARLPMQFPIHVPDDVSLAVNHTWMRTNQDGTITVGLDEFLSRLIGVIDRVSVPSHGEPVAPSASDIAVSVQGRFLRLAPPSAGSVIESNPEVMRNPSLILSDPYGKGWLMRMKSRADDIATSRLYVVRRPVEWLSEQAALVRDFIVMNSLQGEPVTLQEGGLPLDGVLCQFDENVWKDFNRTFAALRRTKDTERKEIHQ